MNREPIIPSGQLKAIKRKIAELEARIGILEREANRKPKKDKKAA